MKERFPAIHKQNRYNPKLWIF